MKILIIDDDVLLRRAIARTLVAEGHDVVTAPDGSRGLVVFRQEHPDIVIADLIMPGQGGLETILALRRVDTSVKIIAIAGHDAETRDTARLLGADDAIEKPFRAQELVDRVRALSAAPLER